MNAATPGSRVAANLVGISPAQIKRGDVVTRPGWLKPTTLCTARLRLLSHLRRPLSHNASVSFHSGAAETMAKVRLLISDEVLPGDETWVQLVLAEPVALVKGDRFIIRSTMDTIGGGEVVESQPKRYRRFREATIQRLEVSDKGDIEQIVLATVESKQPIEEKTMALKTDLPAGEVKPELESLIEQGKVLVTGQGENRLLMTDRGWKALKERAITILTDYHKKYPSRTGMPRAELANRLKLGVHSTALLQKLVDDGIAVGEETSVHLPEHSIRLTREQQSKIDAFLRSLEQNSYSPPTDLIPEPELLNLLIEQQKVVRVSDDVVFSSKAYNEMKEMVTSHLKSNGRITVAQVRDMFQTSRKYALAFLEYLDRLKITRRIGDERVIYQKVEAR
jgi:selenocysteine-specific elongation factor